MKHPLHYLRRIFFFLLIITVSSCEKEDITETSPHSTEHDHINFQLSEKPMEDFIADDKSFVTAYKQVTSKEKGIVAKGKSLEFTINPDKVVKIETEGRVTYTMSIQKKDEAIGVFSNLVIEVTDKNSEYKVYIVEYSRGNGEIGYIAEHNSFSFNGSVRITRIDFDAKDLIAHREETCITLSMTYCNWGGLEHIAGANCTPSHMYSRPYQYCYDTSDPIFGGGGGGGGSVPTVPVLDFHITMRINQVISKLGLTGTKRMWAKTTGNMMTVLEIHEFMDLHHFSNESIAFAKEAVDALVEDEVERFEEFIEETPPSCKAFNFSRLSTNSNWQVAAVKNIVGLVGYYDVQTGDYNTANILFVQPIYFEMPVNSSVNGGYISSGKAAELASEALFRAIQRAKYYFLSTNASQSQVQSKVWEYIRDEMNNGAVAGGKASFTPPLGFTGEINDYERYWFFPDNCD